MRIVNRIVVGLLVPKQPWSESQPVGPVLALCRDRRSFDGYAAWRKRQPYFEYVVELATATDRDSQPYLESVKSKN